MQEQARAALARTAPWKRGTGWPIVTIESLALLGIGIYMLVAADSARNVVRQLIAVILLINGVLEVLVGFRTRTASDAPLRFIRGTVGATIGLIVALEPLSDYLDPEASRVILALGLLAYGLIGLAAMVSARQERQIRVGAVAGSVAFVVLAILLFTGDETDSSRMNLIGTVSIVFGALLLVYALYLYRTNASRSAQPPPLSGAPAPETAD